MIAVVIIGAFVIWALMILYVQKYKKIEKVNATVIQKNSQADLENLTPERNLHSTMVFLDEFGKKHSFILDIKTYENIPLHQKGVLHYRGSEFYEFKFENSK